ncbi:hypothetical protein J3R82DRAFT_3118 [Butyriboletus roseoflavus]|nr:hypothetical protein J3R82DRAFT_3118 [Butyriboletus roseoflavus]
MYDQPDHIRGVQEAYSQYNTPRTPCGPCGTEQPLCSCSPSIVQENNVGGPSNSRGKSGAGNLQAPSSGDDDAQVNSDLLAAWTQRLQVLTVVVRSYLFEHGQLFTLSGLNTQIGIPTGTVSRELVYSCLSGALILHVCACILGYVASFALIRYRIIEDDRKVEGIQIDAAQPAQRPSRRIVLEPMRPLRSFVTCLEVLGFLSTSQSSPPPPLSLLTHCFYTTLGLTTIGTILALTGILAYVWAGLPAPVGIFSTVCLGVGLGAGVWALAM